MFAGDSPSPLNVSNLCTACLRLIYFEQFPNLLITKHDIHFWWHSRLILGSLWFWLTYSFIYGYCFSVVVFFFNSEKNSVWSALSLLTDIINYVNHLSLFGERNCIICISEFCNWISGHVVSSHHVWHFSLHFLRRCLTGRERECNPILILNTPQTTSLMFHQLLFYLLLMLYFFSKVH